MLHLSRRIKDALIRILSNGIASGVGGLDPMQAAPKKGNRRKGDGPGGVQCENVPHSRLEIEGLGRT